MDDINKERAAFKAWFTKYTDDYIDNNDGLVPAIEYDAAFDMYKSIIAQDRQSRAEPVAYLDVSTGGYVELWTDKSEKLGTLPIGRYLLHKASQPAEPVKGPSDDIVYLGCARMGLAGASDEEVLNYVRIAKQRATAPTPPADDQTPFPGVKLSDFPPPPECCDKGPRCGDPMCDDADGQDELRAIHAAARHAGWCFAKYADGTVRMQPLIAGTAQSADGQAQQDADKADARNWPEDYQHENGNYMCRCSTCGETFIGYKRRVTCKVCTKGGQS